MLYPSTCVGLRYGRHEDMLSGFSRQYGYRLCQPPPRGQPYCRRSACAPGRTCLPRRPDAFNAVFRHRAAVSLLRPRVAPHAGHGMLTVCPSPTPVGCGLGPDLPRDDWHRPGNLRLAAGGALTLLIVTYTYICFSMRSSGGRPPAFRAHGMLPYRSCTSYGTRSRAFGVRLIPDYYPRPDPRLVSCYALFE